MLLVGAMVEYEQAADFIHCHRRHKCNMCLLTISERKNVPSRQKTRGTYSWPRTDRRRWPDHGRQKPIKRTPVLCHPPPFTRKPHEHRYPAIPRPSWESLRILQWHQKSQAIFARRRKSIPASSSTSTFYVPSYTKKFDMILAQSTSTTSHKPNKHLETLHHGIAFISCWQWQPDTWSGACRDIQGSSQQQGLGIECWAIVREYITGLFNCLLNCLTAGFHEKNLIL